MSQSIVVLTGAGSGLGRSALFHLRNSHVVATVRNEEAAADLRAVKTGPGISLQICIADLSEPASVDRLVKEINELPRVDLLINNAGLFTRHRELNSLQIEKQMMVNYHTPRRLTLGLEDRLGRSSSPRVVNVVSRMHSHGHIDFDDFNLSRGYSGTSAYAASKLALTAWTIMQARLWQDRICMLALHPGVYATGITRQLPVPLRLIWNAFLPGPETGAKYLIDAAFNPRYSKRSGSYIDRNRMGIPAALALDQDFQEQLERMSEQLLPSA